MKPSVPLLRLFSALPSSWVTTSVNSGPHSGSLSTQVYQLLLSGACEDRTAGSASPLNWKHFIPISSSPLTMPTIWVLPLPKNTTPFRSMLLVCLVWESCQVSTVVYF